MASPESNDVDAQIQEKTVSSFTEDLKMKSENTEETSNEVQESNGVTANEEKMDETPVQESENVTEEKASTEGSEAQEDESMKAENVSSTDAGANANETEEGKANGNAEEKKEDEAQKKDDSLGSTVAKHYNEIPAGTKDDRKESRIFYLRNFNNWIKSVIINEYLEKIKRRKRTSDDVNVLDLGCGKGGDILKWHKGRVDHVIMADIAATSIAQCNERYSKLQKDQRKHSRDWTRLFSMESLAVDCTKELISEKYKKKDIKLDLASCQFAFHYSFESYEQADMMLKNACQNLQVGGYFIGTTPDAQKLVKHIKDCKADSFGNSVFNIKPDDKENFPLFGAKYMFYLEGVVDCPEFLVYFPVLEKLAAKYNMKLVWKKNFHDIFNDNEKHYSSLLHKMNALEQYPAPTDKTLSGGSESQYKAAKDYVDKKDTKHTRVGTLSADEWEVAGLYLAFAFEKVAPPREGRSSEKEDRKRHRERSREGNRSRDSSRHSGHREKKKSDSGSSSTKRSKKESETEEVYEVKDEIYEDEPEKMETATSSDSKAVENTGVDDDTKVAEEITLTAQEEATTEEAGTEVVDGSSEAVVEVAEEATEEKTEEVTEEKTEEVTEEKTEEVTEEKTEEVTEEKTEEVTEETEEKAE